MTKIGAPGRAEGCCGCWMTRLVSALARDINKRVNVPQHAFLLARDVGVRHSAVKSES